MELKDKENLDELDGKLEEMALQKPDIEGGSTT